MAIKVERKKDESDDDAIARAFTKPYVRGALTIDKFTPKGYEVNAGSLVMQLKELCNDDNFNTGEMLKAQAQTLDAIFNNLAQIAALNLNNMNAFIPLMKLALQAQNQAGKTLQVISQNKLLNNDDSVDTRTTTEAIESDKTMATLFAINGGKIS
jgi:hypothetical protein